MENLKGRSVEINSGAVHEILIGEVIDDRGEQIAVYFDQDDSVRYFAKWRLLTSEYAFCDVPSAVGVYLIAKPI